ALGKTNAVPSLVPRVFANPSSTATLAFTRTLDEAGLPLPAVQIDESGPQSELTKNSDNDFAVVTLGQGSGGHTWRFRRDGYLPVWRTQNLTSEQITVLANPRLTARDTNVLALSPLGSRVKDSAGKIEIEFSPASLNQNTTAHLTPITGQTLPGFLP